MRLKRAALCTNLVLLGSQVLTGASMYDKIHRFDLKLQAGESYAVAWQGLADALAGDPRDFDSRPGNFRASPVPPIRAGTTTKADAFAESGPNKRDASADAEASFQANANGTGFHRLKGQSDVGDNVVAVSDARTSLALRKFVGTPGTASFRWKGEWMIDSFQRGRETDPVSFSAIDLDTGLTIEDELFDLVVSLGQGQASWMNGMVSVNATAGSLDIVMDSPHLTSGRGRLSAQFANGKLTASNDSGVFDGLLPAIGGAANFAFPLGDSEGFLNFDFTLAPPNSKGFDMTLTASAEARVEERAPEPSAILLLGSGLVGLMIWSRRKKCRRRVSLVQGA